MASMRNTGSTEGGARRQEETNVVETLQSLIVAFALAMAVRSFVTEGFFIPTGSMAPTLLGVHVRERSPATGYEYAADAGPANEAIRQLGPGYRDFARPFVDPMLSVTEKIGDLSNTAIAQGARMGDRVLVLKYLYAFSEPKRWDVVVFKNPTDPVGDAANFIKRLVGLPNEQLLFLDGDVFTAPLDAGRDAFAIARKPEHVQRAVWQPVFDSDYVPEDLSTLARAWNKPWPGVPWDVSGFTLGAKGNARSWSADTAAPARIAWNWQARPITDFAPYNVWREGTLGPRYAVSDLRVAGAVEADDPAALKSAFVLETRGLRMRYLIENGKAGIRIETAPEPGGDAPETVELGEVEFTAPAAGAPFDVEFWHVDQRCSLWVNGEEVVAADYAFASPEKRLLASFNGRTVEDYVRNAVFQQPTPPSLSWSFEGSPLALRRVRVDRDLYYRPAILRTDEYNQPDENGPAIGGAAFATDFENPARVEADQFVMCGDNSAASRDSRLWGRPSRLVTAVFGVDAPFIVPRPLLLGKAWCVYFPAPVSPMPGLPAVMPDFGHLRFIR